MDSRKKGRVGTTICKEVKMNMVWKKQNQHPDILTTYFIEPEIKVLYLDAVFELSVLSSSKYQL